ARLLALRLALLLLVLVFELAVVEDLADRRFGFRVHLDQVETHLLRDLARFVGGHHAQHAAVGADDADFGDADSMIDADLRPALLHARVKARSPHIHIVCFCLLWLSTIVICDGAEGWPPQVAFPRNWEAGLPRAPPPGATGPTGYGPSL